MSLVNEFTLKDSIQLDAFGQMKVGHEEPLLDSMCEYGSNAYFWETLVVGSGSVTHRPNENSMRLSTGGTTSTHAAKRATRAHLRYQPGRSLEIKMTFVMSATVTNATARIGYFSDRDGIFLQRAGTAVSLVRRTYVTGTAVETTVAQASWNVDTFDGNGPSQVTLDLTKTQIMFIQLQYLGVGRVQIGFVVDGKSYVAHQFLNANSLSVVYMSSGCLPVRGEVINTGAASGTLTMDMICVSVSTRGKGNERIQLSHVNLVAVTTTAATWEPILSIRAAAAFGGGAIPNRAYIIPQQVSILCTSQVHLVQLFLNGALTGPSWVSKGAYSLAEYDVSATAITGGTPIYSDIVSAGATFKDSLIAAITSVAPLVYSSLNGVQDTLTIAAYSMSGSNSAQAAIVWQEEY